MLYEVIKFYNNAESDSEQYKNLTIDEYLKEKNFSEYFKYNHLYPNGVKYLVIPINKIPAFPFKEFVNFFANHGLLRIFNRPKWRTVKGGSRAYVKKILNNKKIRSLNHKATAFINKKNIWEINFNNKVKNMII